MKTIAILLFSLASLNIYAKPKLFELFEKKKNDNPPPPPAPKAYKLGDDPCPSGKHEVQVIKISKLEDESGKVYEQRANSKECADNKAMNVQQR